MLERIQQFRNCDINKIFTDAQKDAPRRIAVEKEFCRTIESAEKPERWLPGT
jgi:hypothetical protein